MTMFFKSSRNNVEIKLYGIKDLLQNSKKGSDIEEKNCVSGCGQ
jgi:hypothetical protein